MRPLRTVAAWSGCRSNNPRSVSGSSARDRSMAVPSCCRKRPAPAATRQARRTCRSTATDGQLERAFPAKTRRTKQPGRLADIQSRFSVLLIAGTESANLVRRNCQLFQQNRPIGDIGAAYRSERTSGFWVGKLQIRLPGVHRYLKHWICFGPPEVARVEPYGIEPLRILTFTKCVRVRENMAAM